LPSEGPDAATTWRGVARAERGGWFSGSHAVIVLRWGAVATHLQSWAAPAGSSHPASVGGRQARRPGVPAHSCSSSRRQHAAACRGLRSLATHRCAAGVARVVSRPSGLDQGLVGGAGQQHVVDDVDGGLHWRQRTARPLSEPRRRCKLDGQTSVAARALLPTLRACETWPRWHRTSPARRATCVTGLARAPAPLPAHTSSCIHPATPAGAPCSPCRPHLAGLDGTLHNLGGAGTRLDHTTRAAATATRAGSCREAAGRASCQEREISPPPPQTTPTPQHTHTQLRPA
jgi:hypothetical protein